MATETLTENDDDIEIVEVEELPADGALPPVKADEEDTETEGEPKADAEADEDDDDEDARLAEADEEDQSPAGKQNRKNRKTRERRNDARRKTIAEVEALRLENSEFRQRLLRLEGAQQTMSKDDVAGRIAAGEADIRTAERVLAAAIAAGNGDDAAEALRLRDEARDSVADLKRVASTIAEPSAPRQAVEQLVSQWKASNPWFGQPGNETATQIAATIDNQVAAAGYDKASPAYYRELSRRLNDHFEGVKALAAEKPQPKVDPGKKKPPPLGGGGRESPNGGGKNTVYVDPGRKQAMIDAGIWDDPVRRQKMLRTYAEYDREASARR